jgi:hypothetical protein
MLCSFPSDGKAPHDSLLCSFSSDGKAQEGSMLCVFPSDGKASQGKMLCSFPSDAKAPPCSPLCSFPSDGKAQQGSMLCSFRFLGNAPQGSMLSPFPFNGKPMLSRTLCQPTRRTCVGLGFRRVGSGAEAPATGIPAAAGADNVAPVREPSRKGIWRRAVQPTRRKNEGLPLGAPEAGRKPRAREFLRQRARTIRPPVWVPSREGIYVSFVYEAAATRSTLRV